MNFPQPADYPAYYGTYILLMDPKKDLMSALITQMEASTEFFRSLPKERLQHRYAPGKWSMKEVIGHMIDTERIMCYRALRIARGDQTPMAGFDQDDYIPAGEFDNRNLEDLLTEWRSVRTASMTLLGSLNEAACLQSGIANQQPISVAALFYIIAGHEQHHMKVLQERYLD